ncbi:iron complex outermembrane receptor protein [Povalibacter uvarum]|uniref:Iron complex outermembrane receptor protein n=1 Tax=Povalibacter uvarum TaxID=732238 RepID=A0A841HX38_9GAMM|nr:TonB-dependent siderophore receptor [Povalibacter uvarum]MBB6096345.1 iron complex outermembrane receptor protein [Povalibacter uvarum]
MARVSDQRLARAVCIALTGLSAVAASAADTSAAPTEVDTVIVNATRIGTSLEEVATSGALGSKKLLDTPFSITVISDEEINRRQANSVAQIFINDPSILSASPSATTAWWGAQIRGLDVMNYYIDGVPFLLSYGGEFPLEPIESVEALKGLTGFMYGFGTPGGAISYTTKKPTEEPLAMMALEYRNDSVFSGQLDAGGRVGDSQAFGYRVNVAGEYGEAYSGADLNRTLVSLAVDYRITSDLEWFANGLYETSKLEHEPLYFYWDMYEDARLPRPTYDYENVRIDNSFYEYDTLMGSTGLRWRINDEWKANLTLGYNEKEHHSNKMFAYVLNEAGDYEGYAYNFAGLLKNYFSRVLVQGEATTGAIRHELVFGIDYQRNTTRWGNDWHWSNDFNGNIYQPQDFVVTRDIDFSLAPLSDDERQTALFASDTLHIGDHWQAMLGGRYTEYEQVDHDHDPTFDSGYDTSEFSPTVALIFKPADYVAIYGSYVEALESGSRVGTDGEPPYMNAGELLPATISKQYELGAKYEHDRLRFTAAAFHVERAAQIDVYRDGDRYLTQDGMTLYDGIEAIGNVNVTHDLTMGLGATFIDPRIDRVSEENAALEGNRPAGAPKRQFVANADYRFPRISGLSVFGTVRYLGDFYYEEANNVLIPDRTIVSTGFEYQAQWGGRRAVITGSINNLLDEKYWDRNTLGEGINGALGVRVYW